MYLIADNNSYTNEAQTKQQIIDKLSQAGEVTFRQSRRSNDFEFVIVNGHSVAKAFYAQSAQISYLVETGIINS